MYTAFYSLTVNFEMSVSGVAKLEVALSAKLYCIVPCAISYPQNFSFFNRKEILLSGVLCNIRSLILQIWGQICLAKQELSKVAIYDMNSKTHFQVIPLAL